jgi:hypothetical protein
MTTRPAVFDRQVLTFEVTRFLQALAECSQKVRSALRGRALEKPNYRRRLLRPCRDRPCGRAAEQRDEVAAL